MLLGIAIDEVHRAEASRIGETQHAAALDEPIDVIVFVRDAALRHDAKRPGHSEMDDHRAALELEDQIFSAPPQRLALACLLRRCARSGATGQRKRPSRTASDSIRRPTR